MLPFCTFPDSPRAGPTQGSCVSMRTKLKHDVIEVSAPWLPLKIGDYGEFEHLVPGILLGMHRCSSGASNVIRE